MAPKGKWSQRLKPAVGPGSVILSHTQICSDQDETRKHLESQGRTQSKSDSVVQWRQSFFPTFFLGGRPTRSGLPPNKWFPFFSIVTEELRQRTWRSLLEAKSNHEGGVSSELRFQSVIQSQARSDRGGGGHFAMGHCAMECPQPPKKGR